MSLADDLAAVEPVRNLVDAWLATLDKTDKTAVEEWVADPAKPATQLWRICRGHGCPAEVSTFRAWVANQRRDDS